MDANGGWSGAYRGQVEERTWVLVSGTRGVLTPKLIANLRRHSASKAEIGQTKTYGGLSRCNGPHPERNGETQFLRSLSVSGADRWRHDGSPWLPDTLARHPDCKINKVDEMLPGAGTGTASSNRILAKTGCRQFSDVWERKQWPFDA